MSNISKKICMIGAFAVGKTSLVGRFVLSMYQDKYLTTVGVKVDKKTTDVDGQQVVLMLWDMAGKDEFQEVELKYMRGASGYLLVVDGTRKATLDTAVELQARIDKEVGKLPFVMVLNKADLADSWEIDTAVVDGLKDKGWTILKGSAKTAEGVDEAFTTLARKTLAGK